MNGYVVKSKAEIISVVGIKEDFQKTLELIRLSLEEHYVSPVKLHGGSIDTIIKAQEQNQLILAYTTEDDTLTQYVVLTPTTIY